MARPKGRAVLCSGRWDRTYVVGHSPTRFVCSRVGLCLFLVLNAVDEIGNQRVSATLPQAKKTLF